MRAATLLLATAALAAASAPALHAYAQSSQEREDDARRQAQSDEDKKKKEKDKEWNLTNAPLPSVKNAGPCPYVKVLYDAARYVELKGAAEASSDVGWTGEIENITADCRYRGAEPITVKLAVNFALGRGPQAVGADKDYHYWVAVTARNQFVLAKQEFTLPVTFAAGQDRMSVRQQVQDITIPRANARVNGSNFEVLVGFDVTPQMADFNRQGKRFKVNAGGATDVAAAK